MSKPLVSVIVPCYNQAQYLDECLQSVLDQSYANWECIIVDDGSPDDTEEVAQKWMARDSRFKYVIKENGGLSSARNAGIEVAEGEWILPLDADDKIGVDYLDLASREFEGGWQIIYCNANLFGTKDGNWELKDFSLTQIAIENVIFCSSFFKRSSWLLAGGYDEKLIYGWEDWDFWINLLHKNTRVLKLNSTQFFYRVKESSMIADLKSSQEKRKFNLNYIYNKYPQFFIDNIGFYQDLVYQISEFERLKSSKKFKLYQKLIKYLSFIK